jgi:hypothetical protein
MIKVFNKKSGYIDVSDTLANTSFGYQSLGNNTGISNAAFGYRSLNKNTKGGNNTANGYHALYSNTTGSYNTANGTDALYSNTYGNYNTANGSSALYSNTTGNINIANGYQALYSNTTGYYNTANGVYSLASNTTGFANTANGVYALEYNTIGVVNTANGFEALYANTTGYGNTANGAQALVQNTTGNYNTADGTQALHSNTTGSSNTALGNYADVLTGDLTHATVIGFNAKVDASNKVRVGNTGVKSIGGQVSWSTFSDGRYKKNIKEDVRGLSFINSLKPITYTVDINGLDAYYDKGRKHDSAYEKMKAEMQPSADAAAKIVYTGFIAQEVEAAAKKLNYDFSGVDKPQSKDGVYGLRYGDFVVPLVKAVQELSKMNDAKDAKIINLEARLAKLEAMMNVQQSAVSKN